MALVLKGPITVNIADVKTTFFVRTALNEERVQFFADLYSSKADVTPIVITVDGPPYEMIEGRHRIEAQGRLGMVRIPAFTTTVENRGEMILEALRANSIPTAPLPSTPGDFRHVINLLLNEGWSRTDILARFPLNKNATARYYTDVRDNRKRTLVAKAVEHMLRGNTSINETAEKFKLQASDISDFLKTRKERIETISANAASGQIETPARAWSGAVARQTARMIQAYQEGDIDAADLRQFANRINDTVRRFTNTGKNAVERLRNAIVEAERAFMVDTKKAGTKQAVRSADVDT